MRIVVAGGGMVGGTLVRLLLKNRHDVVLIESRKEACDRLYAETGIIAIHGLSTEIDVLRDAEVETADVFVAATGNDADNLASVLLVRSLGDARIIVRVRDPAYEDAFELAGVTSILRVTDLMVNQMMTQIEQPEVQRLIGLAGGRANLYVVKVPPGANVTGRTLQDIAGSAEFPSECVVSVIYNRATDQLAIPRGDRVIHEADELFLVSRADDITHAVGVLTATGGDAGTGPFRRRNKG